MKPLKVKVIAAAILIIAVPLLIALVVIRVAASLCSLPFQIISGTADMLLGLISQGADLLKPKLDAMVEKAQK